MIHSFKLRAYRGFAGYELSGLARLNLLVGRNNSGKTSLLEAIQLWVSGGSPEVLWATAERRGELAREDEPDSPRERLALIGHLFHGHRPAVGADLLLSADVAPPSSSVDDGRSARELRLALEAGEAGIELAVGPPERRLALTPELGLSHADARRARSVEVNGASDAVLVTTDSLDQRAFRALLDGVVLTDEEDHLIRALQSIEPRLERIVPLSGATSGGWRSSGRGGVVARLRGVEARVPLGSMGDGIWRLASLALAMVRARGGVLLVDEVDTGLHYTVMDSMWRMVRDAAERLDVQVFATTHSRDCLEALAMVCDDPPACPIAIHRVEAGADRSTAFDADQLRLAAERGIEIR